ncbi:hypothetical protein BCR35DRAFT_333603 [Leucosporidium creatinivorum]|uniref:Glyoxal oxidase n=1 Tax=Leucosporidium creatinivorum TaxID=106004 RepID=A0A1Y2EPS6_9BASI|nr:hypothetical protein BCR35DRAFT_333603 [Leucosporidium creatinivorum]
MRALTLSSLLLALKTTGALAGKANTFEIVGHTGVSAQQLFLGNEKKIYVVDKVEKNPVEVNGHPAWAVEYDLETHTTRALDVITNSFCAGGNVLGNGSWLNVGGNNAVTTGGTCVWHDDPDFMDEAERWYPTLEAVEDGSNIIMGGELWGGFVNSVDQMQNTPTYEFFPTRGDPITMQFLLDTQPANVRFESKWEYGLLNYTSNEELRLPNITHAQRTYPSSGAVAMLPLTLANNYEPTILFCGGMDPVRDDWNQTAWAVVKTPTSNSCVSIAPMDGKKAKWIDEDDMPENRGMGSAVILPDDRIFVVNGSYATDPVTRPAYYNHTAPKGSQWDSDLPHSTVNSMYHSVATLIPDGSIFIAGSNPNADVITEENNSTYLYKTEYRSEIFYPSYYDQPRPEPTGMPASISYGGDHFDLELPASSIEGVDLAVDVKVKVIRTGFSTHAMNFGMKSIELATSYSATSSGATLHVSQLPPNPALFQPGPALLFVVISGVPSHGVFVMCGSGQIETQPLLAATVLPKSTTDLSASSSTSTNGTSGAKKLAAESGAARSVGGWWSAAVVAVVVMGLPLSRL